MRHCDAAQDKTRFPHVARTMLRGCMCRASGQDKRSQSCIASFPSQHKFGVYGFLWWFCFRFRYTTWGGWQQTQHALLCFNVGNSLTESCFVQFISAVSICAWVQQSALQNYHLQNEQKLSSKACSASGFSECCRPCDAPRHPVRSDAGGAFGWWQCNGPWGLRRQNPRLCMP